MLTWAGAAPALSRTPITVTMTTSVRIMGARVDLPARKSRASILVSSLVIPSAVEEWSEPEKLRHRQVAEGRASGSERVNLRLVSSFRIRGLGKAVGLIQQSRLALFAQI